MEDITVGHDKVLLFARVRQYMFPKNALVGTKLARITDALSAEFKRIAEKWDEAAQRYAKRTSVDTAQDGTTPVPKGDLIPRQQGTPPQAMVYSLTGTPMYVMNADDEAALNKELEELVAGSCEIRARKLTNKDLEQISVEGGDIGDALVPFADSE